ncbi:hypothetical protein HSIEG1_3300 [Enterococcus sp. HSIEG1]|nr:hypothetical protein HSIEG1_3300 [Enterococcus sp. HSIEG1]
MCVSFLPVVPSKMTNKKKTREKLTAKWNENELKTNDEFIGL